MELSTCKSTTEKSHFTLQFTKVTINPFMNHANPLQWPVIAKIKIQTEFIELQKRKRNYKWKRFLD